jgi:hypothetical protein
VSFDLAGRARAARTLNPARSAIVEAIGLYRSVNIVQIDGRFWFEYGHSVLHRRKLRVFFDLSVFSPRSVVIDQNQFEASLLAAAPSLLQSAQARTQFGSRAVEFG